MVMKQERKKNSPPHPSPVDSRDDRDFEWKLVPIKPTLEMAEKGAEAFSLPHPQSVGAENERAAIIYRLMLDAAPEGRPDFRRDKWELEWRPVVGWEDHYEVSNTGRIRKMDGTLLTQWANGDGYMLVRLSNPRGKILVHRAVAEAFIPNPNSLPFVNHVDNDRAHNCDFNLEWCTQKENLDHSRKQGRMPDNYWVGKRSPNASLTDDIVLEIRQLYASGAHSYQALAEKFGISKRAIGRLINRESYADV